MRNNTPQSLSNTLYTSLTQIFGSMDNVSASTLGFLVESDRSSVIQNKYVMSRSHFWSFYPDQAEMERHGACVMLTKKLTRYGLNMIKQIHVMLVVLMMMVLCLVLRLNTPRRCELCLKTVSVPDEQLASRLERFTVRRRFKLFVGGELSYSNSNQSCGYKHTHILYTYFFTQFTLPLWWLRLAI